MRVYIQNSVRRPKTPSTSPRSVLCPAEFAGSSCNPVTIRETQHARSSLPERSSGPDWTIAASTLSYTRRRSEGKHWRKKYVSPNLVYSHWANFGGYREIGDARAYDDLLDDRARHHRIDHRRGRYPHVFAPDKRTISSRRPHFFHTGRDPDSLHLL